ncbi:MAG: PKD domain-containing protein [Candidatus Thermoplasmatota archaeon]|nr:PKD domain-containing protein [Candidatus Thermoplasmatota archaeon]
MKLKYLSLILVILVLPLASAELDKPNWSTGDFWEYSGSYVGTASMVFENQTMESSIDSTVTLNIRVNDVEVRELEGKLVGCYVASVTSRLTGTFTYKFGEQQFSGNFEFDASGTSTFTTTDLAVVETDIQLNISINIPNIPPYITTQTVYNPPFDFMDFPVQNGEQWTASSQATSSYMGGQPSTAPISFTFKCTRVSGSGDNEVYDIQTDYVPFIGEIIPINNTVIKWAEDKGMIERIIGSSSAQQFSLQLGDYKYEGEENIGPTASFTVDKTAPKVGDVVSFDASGSSDSDGSIVLYQWDFDDGYNDTGRVVTHQFGKQGDYTVSLTVVDNYGQTHTATKTVTVAGSDGGSSPGFEAVPVALALLAVLLLARKKRRSP